MLTPFSLASLLTGDLGVVNLSFLSRSSSLCVGFSSDSLTELTGFNATYNKLYSNTNITGQSSLQTCLCVTLHLVCVALLACESFEITLDVTTSREFCPVGQNHIHVLQVNIFGIFMPEMIKQ